MRLLIVEDDEVLLDGITVGLRLSGFTVDAVTTRADAILALEAGGFDAMVLDLMLPDGSGLDVLTWLRERRSTLPVLLLTARDQVQDRVTGLDAGADDYIGKPFDLNELAARLRAILRRNEGRAVPDMRWNGLSVDPARMVGCLDGAEIRFSRREFAILRALMERPGAIIGCSALEERLSVLLEEIGRHAAEVQWRHLS